jgi:hypothetical protein
MFLNIELIIHQVLIDLLFLNFLMIRQIQIDPMILNFLMFLYFPMIQYCLMTLNCQKFLQMLMIPMFPMFQ